MLIASDRVPEAKKRLKQSISHLESHPDAKHKELLGVALRFLAEAHITIGEMRDAENELKKSLEILEGLGPDASVQAAYSLSDLCGVYLAEGRFGEAEQKVTRAMKILSDALGPESPAYVRADMIYSACTPMSKETRHEVIGDGVSRMEYVYGAKHPNIARALAGYFKALTTRGDKEKIAEAEQRFGLAAAKDRV